MKAKSESSPEENLEDFDFKEEDEEALIEQQRIQWQVIVQKYKDLVDNSKISVPSEFSSSQSSTGMHLAFPEDDILERVATNVKEHELENVRRP